jgi:hypothetical protein
LATIAEENEHNRDQRFKEQFEIISLVAMWVLAAGMFIAAAIWFYHLVTPYSWPRLCQDQIDDIQSLLTGGLIVGILANHFQKRIG